MIHAWAILVVVPCATFVLGDTLIVDKLVFSSTANETFVVPLGMSDERPDPACWFTAFLSVNSLDVKQDCIKNLNNDKDFTFTPPGRLFFHTAPSSQVSNPDFVLQSFECAEQNCNPGVAGGDDCKFDQSCSAFGVSTGDMVRQMRSDVRLQFKKNQWTVATAELPDYKISFNLTWIVDAIGVVPTAGTPSPGGVTPSPGGLTPRPGGAPQLDGTTMGEDTGPATMAAAPLDQTIMIVVVVGVVVLVIIVLAIVCVVVRARKALSALPRAATPHVPPAAPHYMHAAADFRRGLAVNEPLYADVHDVTAGYSATAAEFTKGVDRTSSYASIRDQ
jgi:hypothetical protein